MMHRKIPLRKPAFFGYDRAQKMFISINFKERHLYLLQLGRKHQVKSSLYSTRLAQITRKTKAFYLKHDKCSIHRHNFSLREEFK